MHSMAVVWDVWWLITELTVRGQPASYLAAAAHQPSWTTSCEGGCQSPKALGSAGGHWLALRFICGFFSLVHGHDGMEELRSSFHCMEIWKNEPQLFFFF